MVCLSPKPASVDSEAKLSSRIMAVLKHPLYKTSRLILSVGLLSAAFVAQGPSFLLGMGVAGVAFKVLRLAISRFAPLRNLFSKLKHKLKAWHIAAPLVSSGLFFKALSPAHAQFMSNMEDFFGEIEEIDDDVVELVFDVLRGILLLYVAVSLIRVINAVRNDDDWQTLARAPIMIVLVVAVGEVVTGMITG